MTTKTSLHVQRIEPWMSDAIQTLGASWVKLVNPPADDPMPEIAHKLVRIWTDSLDSQYIIRGREGGIDFVQNMLRVGGWGERRWATCYSLANEPECNSNEGIVQLRDYTLGAMAEASRQGIKLAVLEWAEGNPHDNGTGDSHVTRWKVRQFLPVIEAALKQGHYIGLHAYWRPDVEGPTGDYHALGRVRRDLEYWGEKTDIRGLKVLVTEWGVDGGIAGHPAYQGWRDFYIHSKAGVSAYFGEVAQGERMAQRMLNIEAMFLFTSGFEPPWGGYNHEQRDMLGIAEAMVDPWMAIARDLQRHIIPLNPHAAIAKAAPIGYLPASDEYDIIWGGVAWRYQGFRSAAHPDKQLIGRCKVGDWGHIEWLEIEN